MQTGKENIKDSPAPLLSQKSNVDWLTAKNENVTFNINPIHVVSVRTWTFEGRVMIQLSLINGDSVRFSDQSAIVVLEELGIIK